MTSKKTRIIGETTMGWFGPHKDEVWRQLSVDIGAEFIEGGFWKGNKVQAHVGPWTVTSDLGYSRDDAESRTTQIRAPYANPDGFQFKIFRRSVLSDLGKLLGMQDIAVGDPYFDEEFVIKGNSEDKVRDLFANPKIRKLIQAQSKIRLEVKDSEGWLFPEDVDELHFEVVGVIKEVERLKALFDLFATVLDELCRIGSAYKQEPGVEL
jgi:hypothetical protein